MKNFQQKRGFKHILHSKPVLVLLGVILLFFAWGMIGFFGKMELTKQNREIAEKKLDDLEIKKEKLSSDISKLNTQAGIEESIREKFGFARDGEGVIVIIDNQNKPKEIKKTSGGFFSFFINFFK